MTGERLPSGTVAFAFTDVEGSTTLLRALGEGWAPLLRTCHGLLREAVEQYDGVVVDTEGDGAFLAFHDVQAAVRALAQAQARLLSHPWPENAPVRVRMGLHVGCAEPVDGRYVALAVHEAARVGAVAHGGQLVLSEQAVLLLGGALPDGAMLRDRGRFGLRDFPLPVRLYDVTAPGLPPVERGLRALPADGGNLPPAAGRLYGRDDVLATLAEPARLTTVAGPPGVGKSATALAAARATSAADGVWLVPLEQLSTLRSLGEAVLSTIGLPVGSGIDAVVAQLAGRAALLVLDGADERAAEVAELALALGVRAPRVRLLVTARAPLGLQDERVVRLEPLPVPSEEALPEQVLATPSVRLLLDGSGRRWHDRRHASALAGLARSADGLPLALELVGARLAALSPADLLTRVEAQLARAGRGGALRTALDSAWTSLPEPARLLWQRLSVFAAAVDLEAVEQVCADAALPEDDVLDALGLLVAGSVVLFEQDESGRASYRLLRSVRSYGGERLAEAGQDAAARDRHGRWAADAVERWVRRADAEPPPGPLLALAAARDDVLGGLGHLAADDPGRVLALVLPLRRLLRESLDLADLLALAERLDPVPGSAVVVGLLRGQLSWERAPGPDTLPLLEAAADAAEQATPAVRIQVLTQLVMAREQFGLQSDPARDGALSRAAEQSADPGLLVRATAALAHTGSPQDQVLLDRAVDVARTQAQGLLHWVTGRRLQLWAGRRPATAREDIERLLLALPVMGASESSAGLLVAAFALMALGDPERARRLAEQAASAAARRRNLVIGFHAAVMRAAAAGAVAAPDAEQLLIEAESSPVARLGSGNGAMVAWARGWVLAGSDRELAQHWARDVPMSRTIVDWQLRALADAVRDPTWQPTQGLLAHVSSAGGGGSGR